MKNRILSASTINGKNVKNLADENIGEIEDLMINPENGKVEYAVLSFGGFLGIGDKYFAIPVESLKFSTKNENIILDIDKETLKNAPGFDKNNWPQEASPDFLRSMYDHYGYEYEPNKEYVRK